VNFQVVDRVQLDRFELESVDLVKRERIKEPCDFEDPVDFVRIVHSSRDVVSWVDGWPAAFWVPFGEGEVLITTLGPRGWRAPKTERPTIALQTIAGRLFANREGRVDPQAFQSSLQQQIGYRVPSRSIAMSVLGGYCFALLASGGILAPPASHPRSPWGSCWKSRRKRTRPASPAWLPFTTIDRKTSISPPTIATG
jgi:hypothetical protein